MVNDASTVSAFGVLQRADEDECHSAASDALPDTVRILCVPGAADCPKLPNPPETVKGTAPVEATLKRVGELGVGPSKLTERVRVAANSTPTAPAGSPRP